VVKPLGYTEDTVPGSGYQRNVNDSLSSRWAQSQKNNSSYFVDFEEVWVKSATFLKFIYNMTSVFPVDKNLFKVRKITLE